MTRRDAITTTTAAALASAVPVPANAEAKLTTDFTLRPANERGKANHGWLDSAHSFSFGSYFDLNHMQFENLRVINDDRVDGGAGFPQHPHQNAEIFSYVLEGGLEHRDSLGNGSVVNAGGVQYMSAGSGVSHAEFNPSQTEQMRFLQVWLLPNVENEAPRYETMDLSPEDKDGKLKLFLSPTGRNGSMRIKANADIFAATLSGNQIISYDLPVGRKAYIQLARGTVEVNGQKMVEGDGLAVHSGGQLIIEKGSDAEFLLFDLKPGLSN